MDFPVFCTKLASNGQYYPSVIVKFLFIKGFCDFEPRTVIANVQVMSLFGIEYYLEDFISLLLKSLEL